MTSLRRFEIARSGAMRATVVFGFVALLTINLFYFPAAASNSTKALGQKPVSPSGRIKTDEVRLWRSNPALQKIAKGLNPLKVPIADGALGINRRFPEKVQVSHQAEGWNWIRSGVAMGNGFIIDRGIMAFEWAFARMTDDGGFGESKTIDIAHFLGLYARSVLLLRSARQDSRAERLARLVPRLEISLRSSRSLLGERRWNGEELKNWVTHQRVQAAVSAYWIGRLMINPGLQKTSELWLDEALRRQEAIGFFPSGFPPQSNAAWSAQVEILEALQGLALQDSYYSTKLQLPLKNGFRWLEKSFNSRKAKIGLSSLATFASYAALTGDKYAAGVVTDRLKAFKL